MPRKSLQLVLMSTAFGAIAASVAYAQAPLPLPPEGAAPVVELPQAPLPLPPDPAEGLPPIQNMSPPPLPQTQPNPTSTAQPPAQAPNAKGALGNLLGINKATEEQPAAVPVKAYSYGDSNLSILFLPEQVLRMKEAIRAFEDTNTDAKPTTFAAPEPVTLQAAQKITEPNSYPVFFLSSIVYNAPNDWSLWVSGHKITSRKNNTDLQVVNVTRDSATFAWAPSYIQAINRRKETKQFAQTDEIKNKLAANQAIHQEENNTITFSLRQNQTFAVAYFSIFEGYMESPKLAPLTVTAPNGMPTDPMADPSGVSAPGMSPNGLPPGMQQPDGTMQNPATSPGAPTPGVVPPPASAPVPPPTPQN